MTRSKIYREKARQGDRLTAGMNNLTGKGELQAFAAKWRAMADREESASRYNGVFRSGSSVTDHRGKDAAQFSQLARFSTSWR
jgi:hypothetical protein